MFPDRLGVQFRGPGAPIGGAPSEILLRKSFAPKEEVPPEGLVRSQTVRPTVLIGGSGSDCVDRPGAQGHLYAPEGSLTGVEQLALVAWPARDP